MTRDQLLADLLVERYAPTRDPVADYLMPLVEAGRAVGEIPLLSSPEWAALDRKDPLSTAAVARAALCWHLDGQPDVVRERLAQELDDMALFVRFRWAEASHDVAGGYKVPVTPSHAELQRRRAELLQVPVENLGVA